MPSAGFKANSSSSPSSTDNENKENKEHDDNEAEWHGFLFGGTILIFLGILVLILSEMQSLRLHRSFSERLSNVLELPPRSAMEDSSFLDSLVHMTFQPGTNLTLVDPPTDPLFGVIGNFSLPTLHSSSPVLSIRLYRQVDLYQWVEKKVIEKVEPSSAYLNAPNAESSEGEMKSASPPAGVVVAPNQDAGSLATTYHYSQRWVPAPIDDSHFFHRPGHRNVGTLPMPSAVFSSGKVIGTVATATATTPNRSHVIMVEIGSTLLSQLKRKESISIDHHVTIFPEGSQVNENAIFIRTTEDVPWEDDNEKDETDSDTSTKVDGVTRGEGQDDASTTSPSITTKGPIVTTTMTLDGEETTLYKVVATGETFSTRAKAEEAVLMINVDVSTMMLDGEERTLYTVDEETFSSKERALQAAAKLQADQGIFKTKKKKYLPRIGDVRVRFYHVPLTSISVVAQLSKRRVVANDEGKDDEEEYGNSNKSVNGLLEPWASPLGPAFNVGLIEEGVWSAKELFEKARKDRQVETWVKRFLGWLLLMIGFAFVTHMAMAPTVPFSMEKCLPFAPAVGGRISRMLHRWGVWFSNIVLALCISSLVVASTWMRETPLTSIQVATFSVTLFLVVSTSWGQPKKDKTE